MAMDKKASWKCLQCRNANMSSTAADITTVLHEIKAMRGDLNSMRSDITSNTKAVEEFNYQLSCLAARFNNLDSRISTVETIIQKDLTSANITIDELRRVNNEQDQHSRLNNVEISGVPVSNGENLLSIVRDICHKVAFQLQESDVDYIHRVRRFVNPNISEGQTQSSSSRPPAIIVRFSRRLRKDTLIAAVRARRGLTTADIGLPGPTVNLYVSDHLTPSNKLLLKQARKIKEDLHYSYLWIVTVNYLLERVINLRLSV
ncbi:uncharacterized protein LOC126971897 [Leptidea sinapis]|uniref:uncharacterized protein LOC126971897 n=1 Tax=Leptidea sinapis TaxID=189913 RepID=UPI0021C4C1A5|nr:uncharacterized protein LOC126971897 [Leptidea sinapis]